MLTTSSEEQCKLSQATLSIPLRILISSFPRFVLVLKHTETRDLKPDPRPTNAVGD